MIAFGRPRPSIPTWLDSTMIIGASATMGTVWLMMTQGIRLMFTTRL